MENHPARRLTIAAICIALVAAGIFVYKYTNGTIHIPGTKHIDQSVTANSPSAKNPTNDPFIAELSIRDGYAMNIFAKNIKDARVIAFDPKGRMLVSETSEGRIVSIVDSSADGTADTTTPIISSLNKPHGLALLCPTNADVCALFVAQASKLTSYDYDLATGTASNPKKLADFPTTATDLHFTRSLLLLPDQNTLLISVGSSCNACVENDMMRGRIMAYTISTSKMTEYARGLRNSVFMAINPTDGKLYATEMGRDGLGDEIPPDEINIIEPGKDYGWPNCYSKNVHDDVYDTKTYIRNPCMEPFETPSFIDIQAHSAPLGLAFMPSDWGVTASAPASPTSTTSLFVAFHGSWNRTVPTGYKITKITLDSAGNYVSIEDFITGWLTADGQKIGRPVAVTFGLDKNLYISDDVAGNIYRVVRQ